MFIPNTPVLLLYVTGQFAERDVSPIFVATIPERVESLPERERISPVAVARFIWRFAMFPVAVAILELIVTSCPVIVQ